MKISELTRKDVESCAFLVKMLKAAKYEVEGSAVNSMAGSYQWVHDLSHAIAEGWNRENPVKDPPKGVEGPRNVKINNPPASIGAGT